MKILLIDDEQSILDVFTQVLETAGFQVTSSLTGYDGIEKAKETQPDLILLDQVMPDITGNQVLQLLKQTPTTQHIPVAMLSNFNQDGLVKDAINLGAIDYILKYQISPQDIIDRINNLFKEMGKPSESRLETGPTAPMTPPAEQKTSTPTPTPSTPASNAAAAPASVTPPSPAATPAAPVSTPPVATTPPPAPTVESKPDEQKVTSNT